MVQNIKTDIIYYKTNTDFEMEFNLCGCCRMRLLTDKVSEKRTLISDLSRAVSRSRIIIIVGALFGDDNIIENISVAISKKMVSADNKTYGINSSQEIDIIEGSVPLVTEDGIYGGCIIESGPQTMILLSESKNIRKSIMNSLIHPYIVDVFEAEQESETEAEDMKENIEAIPEEINEEVPTEVLEEAVEEIAEEALNGEVENTETEEVAQTEEENIQAEDTTEESQEQEETQETADEESKTPADEDDFYSSVNVGIESISTPVLEDDDIELYSEPRRIRRKETKFYNDAYSDFDIDDSGLISDYEYDENYRGAPSFSKIAIMILSVLILVAVGVLCYAIFYVPSQEGVSSGEYIRDIFNTLFG